MFNQPTKQPTNRWLCRPKAYTSDTELGETSDDDDTRGERKQKFWGRFLRKRDTFVLIGLLDGMLDGLFD